MMSWNGIKEKGVVPCKVAIVYTFLLVCDDHVFKDDKLFYRFRKDDGTFEEPPDAAILAKGQRIYGRYGHFMTIMCLEFHTLRGVFTCITTFACMYTKLIGFIVHLCMICTHY